MAEITNLSSQISIETKNDPDSDPNIIRVAKLALILANKEASDIDKLACIKLGILTGFLTEQEGAQLFAYRDVLADFL